MDFDDGLLGDEVGVVPGAKKVSVPNSGQGLPLSFTLVLKVSVRFSDHG